MKTENCEICKSRKADRFNETVRTRGTETVHILNICNRCFEKRTGAK